jgi:hypothetical protein
MSKVHHTSILPSIKISSQILDCVPHHANGYVHDLDDHENDDDDLLNCDHGDDGLRFNDYESDFNLALNLDSNFISFDSFFFFL